MSTSTISSARSATSSCSSSPTQPIQIGFSSPSSTMTRPRHTSDASIVFGSPSPSGPAAFPSWKLARPQLPQGPASSYFSDEDLFGDDEVAYLNEAPEPPRTAEQWSASKRGMAMAMAANASLVTLDSSCESYNSFGFSNGYTPSKPIMMKK